MNPLCLGLETEHIKNARNQSHGNVHNNHNILTDHAWIDQNNCTIFTN